MTEQQTDIAKKLLAQCNSSTGDKVSIDDECYDDLAEHLVELGECDKSHPLNELGEIDIMFYRGTDIDFEREFYRRIKDPIYNSCN